MKHLHWLIILIPFLVISLIFAVGCEEPEPTEQPDIPRYRADQVLYVASSYSPSCPGIYEASYAARYSGNGLWLVTKKCVYLGNVYSTEQWYFHEDTGELNKSRY